MIDSQSRGGNAEETNNVGLIIGLVSGGLCLCAICAVASIFYVKRFREKHAFEQTEIAISLSPSEKARDVGDGVQLATVHRAAANILPVMDDEQETDGHLVTYAIKTVATEGINQCQEC